MKDLYAKYNNQKVNDSKLMGKYREFYSIPCNSLSGQRIYK